MQVVIVEPGCFRTALWDQALDDLRFERLNLDRLTRYHTNRLAALGYAVTLTKRTL